MKRVLQFGMTPNYGGVEAFIMNIYRNLDHNKIQFDFLVTTEKKISYEDEIKKLGGRIIRQKYYSRKKYPMKHYKELINYFKNNHDVIAVHLNKADLYNIDVLLVARLMKIPIRIIHSHISYFNHKMNLLEKLNRFLLKLSVTHFFACSESAGNYMFNNKKYEVIKDGVNISQYQFSLENRRNIRKKFNLSDRDFIVGSIGRFCEQKNTLFLLDVFNEIHKKAKHYKLLLIGNGPLKNDVENKIHSFHLDDSVILIDETTNVSAYYSAMDVFLFPSLYEGFGMVLLEAQINGLKCFASKDVIPEMVNVTEEIEFIFLNLTPSEWARKILEYQDIERYNKIGQIKRAGYDSKEISKKLEKIYLMKN